MVNILQNIITNFENGSDLKIVNQNFSDEIFLDQYLQCAILDEINLLSCDFKNIDFIRSSFVACNFEKCKFEDTIFRKCEF